MNRFDRSDIHTHNMDPIQYMDLIQYHQDAVDPIEFIGSNFYSLWDYIPRYCEDKKKEKMRLWKSIFSHLLLLHCSF